MKWFHFLSFEGSLGRQAANTSANSTSGTAPEPGTGLDFASLAPAVQRHFRGGLAPLTQRIYTSAMKKFNTFCIECNMGEPFPVTEQLLCSYAAYLADAGLAPQTIKSYLAAVRDMQISIGLPDRRDQSSLPILKRVQAGINRTRQSDNQPWEVRLPITPHLL